jgi:hypothetical protein
MFAGSVVTVTDTPTLILAADWRRQSVTIRNVAASAAIKLGGSDVTYSTGFSLLHGEGLCLDLNQFIRDATAALYGIADTGQSASIEILMNRS